MALQPTVCGGLINVEALLIGCGNSCESCSLIAGNRPGVFWKHPNENRFELKARMSGDIKEETDKLSPDSLSSQWRRGDETSEFEFLFVGVDPNLAIADERITL